MRDPMSGLRPDPRSTDELIDAALTTDNEDDRWEYVQMLQFRGTVEVFEAARRLCNSSNSRDRELGADILGQFGGANKPKESADILVSLLSDDDPDVLISAATALPYHKAPPTAVESLMRLRDHPDAHVRAAVAHALGYLYLQYSGYAPGTIVDALIELSSDADREVRVEATTGLIYADPVTEEVHDALRRRTEDKDGEVRANALLGLAEQHFPNIVDLLIREFSEGEVWDDALDAAAEAADPRLLPILMNLKGEGVESKYLDRAIEACSERNRSC